MQRPALIRRHSIWLPTAWGGLLAVGVATATLFGAVAFALPRVHAFLAPDAPLGAEVAVVEGWMGPDELRAAVPILRAAGYRRIVTTGGRIPDWADRLGAASYAELARQYLVEQGLAAEDVVAVAAPDSAQDRTYLSAVYVRMWAQAQASPPRTIDVVSAGAHARRSWRLYALAFGDAAQIGIRSIESTDYPPGAWWKTSAGSRVVLGEGIGWLWSVLFFHPPVQGGPEELWGDPEAIQRWREAQAQAKAGGARPGDADAPSAVKAGAAAAAEPAAR
ncbi:MAG: ElyC/SanA/YdcF family protein [Myxococcota bacterium]